MIWVSLPFTTPCHWSFARTSALVYQSKSNWFHFIAGPSKSYGSVKKHVKVQKLVERRARWTASSKLNWSLSLVFVISFLQQEGDKPKKKLVTIIASLLLYAVDYVLYRDWSISYLSLQYQHVIRLSGNENISNHQLGDFWCTNEFSKLPLKAR